MNSCTYRWHAHHRDGDQKKGYQIILHPPVPCSRCCYGPGQLAWKHRPSPHVQNASSLVGTLGTLRDTPGIILKKQNKKQHYIYSMTSILT